jgi:hypothetical protein
LSLHHKINVLWVHGSLQNHRFQQVISFRGGDLVLSDLQDNPTPGHVVEILQNAAVPTSTFVVVDIFQVALTRDETLECLSCHADSTRIVSMLLLHLCATSFFALCNH